MLDYSLLKCVRVMFVICLKNYRGDFIDIICLYRYWVIQSVLIIMVIMFGHIFYV